jgi:DNA polymerase III epsilon subunit-like protein
VELVALDLEGSGAQDRDREAILEVALVPIIDWQPDMVSAYCTLINPERPIPQRPWISPGLTNTVLRGAPRFAEVEPELARRINGKYLVGHNIGVDWRLLHRRSPDIAPVGLIDTLRLARTIDPSARNSLGTVIERFCLTEDVNRLAIGGAPHRALWDTVAVAVLLPALARLVLGGEASNTELLTAAGVPATATKAAAVSQPSLFD